MISFRNKKVDIDLSNKCTLECPMCARQELKKLNKKVPGGDMSIEDFEKVCDYYGSDEEGISLCGPISDPIFNPNFIEILKVAYRKNKKVYISTAATSKKKDLYWYEKAFDANPNATWIFGLDGLPDKSWVYRINQDSDLIFDAMKLCVNKGLDTVWQYLVFGYNENDIDDAKKVADKNNINLVITHTSRYWSDLYRPTKEIVKKTIKEEMKVFKPKCLSGDRPAYISATGQVLPCCWVDKPTEDLLSTDKVLSKLNIKELNINNIKNIEEIYEHKVYIKFYNDLKNQSKDCSSFCRSKCSTTTTNIKERYGKLSRKS
tara:strand:- start:704 stop:1657 length:954 start_codon:yes stop_codon:yes gene_type:complete